MTENKEWDREKNMIWQKMEFLFFHLRVWFKAKNDQKKHLKKFRVKDTSVGRCSAGKTIVATSSLFEDE